MMGTILTLLFGHWFADFILQPDEWARNKWHDNKVLRKHALVYALGMFLMVWLLLFPMADWFTWTALLTWAVVNGGLHFVTDWVTSRDMHFYRTIKDHQTFFILYGIDQMIHYVTLAITYRILIMFLQ